MQRDPQVIASEADQRARDARTVLEHPGLQRAFAAAEETYLARIRRSDPVHGQHERETAFLLLHVLDALRADLQAAAAGAAIARRNFKSSLNKSSRS